MVNTWDQLTVEAESVSLGDGHLRALANQKWSWWSRDLVLTNHSSPGRGWWRARCGRWGCGRWWWACTRRSGTCSSATTFIVCIHYIKYFGILQACPTMDSTVQKYILPAWTLWCWSQIKSAVAVFDFFLLSQSQHWSGVGTQFITLPL